MTFALSAGPAAAAEDFSGLANGEGSGTVDHAGWSALLAAYVVPDEDGLNRIKYKAFKENGLPALKAYLKTLAAVDVTSLTREEQIAFWTNLYNAKTMDIVLEHYPVRSIKDIDISPGLFSDGPWGKKIVTVNSVELSLDNIEHDILRKEFPDPRVHYSVNCASVGCPNLPVQAFTGAELEKQLDAAARAYINSSRGILIKGNRVTASKIYKWYREDFGGSEAGVLEHVIPYAEPELAARLKNIGDIRSYAYDWSLNEAP